MLTSCPRRRTQNHIRHLLELIAQFPRVNPSAAAGAREDTGSEAELDIPRLFRQIRSRYKLLCATLGVRPTLRAADGAPAPASPDRRTAAAPDADTQTGADADVQVGIGTSASDGVAAARPAKKEGVVGDSEDLVVSFEGAEVDLA